MSASLFKSIKVIVDLWLPPPVLSDIDHAVSEYLDTLILKFLISPSYIQSSSLTLYYTIIPDTTPNSRV